MEITIPGATSLRCTPDRGIDPAPAGLTVDGPQSTGPVDAWAPKAPMPGRRSPQIDPWKGLVRGPVAAGEPGAAPNLDETSEEAVLAREEREKKATKSDKAPVPTYLWEKHLVDDGPSPWNQEQCEGLARAMDIARQYGLRWWKKALYRGLMRWSKKKHSKKVKQAKAWSNKKGPSVQFNLETKQYEWRWNAKGVANYQS